jgi:hypothetical protein
VPHEERLRCPRTSQLRSRRRRTTRFKRPWPIPGDVEEWLTFESPGGPKLSTHSTVPRTFETFVDDFKANVIVS